MNETKQYLYHRVPDSVERDEHGREVLHPLNILKENFPDLYQVAHSKYQQLPEGSADEKRKAIPNRLIPTLEQAAWGDVIHLTAVHPEDLKNALVEAGLHPKEMKFYQVDPELLDPSKTTIYLYREGIEDESGENFAAYDPEKLHEHSQISERTKNYYKEKAAANQSPLLFVGVPHILHKGSIDVSNFPVIAVTAEENE